MLVILSPSKTLDYNSAWNLKNYTIPTFLKESLELNDILKQLNVEDLMKLMKISNSIAQLNFHRINDWRIPFSEEKAKPAILAFKGDVYEGLKADNFTLSDFEFSMKKLRILSGLYGILRPLDLIMPYRLEMGITLKNSKGKNLYKFWSDLITAELNKIMKNNSQELLVNLASAEYFKVINTKNIEKQIITPVFKELVDGKYVVIGIKAKKARGLMANYIIRNRISDIEKLKEFSKSGYYFNPDFSNNSELVFIKQH